MRTSHSTSELPSNFIVHQGRRIVKKKKRKCVKCKWMTKPLIF